MVAPVCPSAKCMSGCTSSPKSVMNPSAPRSRAAVIRPAYQALAAGLLKSMTTAGPPKESVVM